MLGGGGSSSSDLPSAREEGADAGAGAGAGAGEARVESDSSNTKPASGFKGEAGSNVSSAYPLLSFLLSDDIVTRGTYVL